VQPTEHSLAVDQRVKLDAPIRVDDLRLDTPRGEPTVAAVDLRQALRRRCDLEAADLEEARLALVLERDELLDGVAREVGEDLGAAGLEHQTRGV
jgi:hypothetical protein